MKKIMNFKVISLLFLLSAIAQAINPFEGDLPRKRCQKGRSITGCTETLVEAYKKTKLSESDKNMNDASTYMMLYTRDNKKNPEYLDDCGGRLPTNTLFNVEWDTEIIVHGFTNGVCLNAWMLEIKDQLLYRDNFNVILIDYSWGNQIDYYDSVNNVQVVGKQIAFLIQNMVKQTGVKTEKFHIIGHSLGGQIAGIAGHYVQSLVGTKLRRITGLDPAGPGFQKVPLEKRLDKGDANLVDIIHSNAGECVPFAFGFRSPLGHADFYPNGGSVQLSCIPFILESLLKGDISNAFSSLLLPACFHQQSIQYYKVSINPCKCEFIGVLCDNYDDFKSEKCRSCGTDGSDCAVMGMDWEYYPRKDGNHSYFLDTDIACPYCNNKPINRQGFPLLPEGKKASCFPKSSTLPILGELF